MTTASRNSVQLRPDVGEAPLHREITSPLVRLLRSSNVPRQRAIWVSSEHADNIDTVEEWLTTSGQVITIRWGAAVFPRSEGAWVMRYIRDVVLS